MPNGQQRRRMATYEGRPVARPDEDIVDQGLGFDIGILLGRRQMLRLFGLGVTAAGLAACGSGSSSSSSSASSSSAAVAAASGEIPDETAGPYPGDGSNGPNVLDDSGIVRGDIRSSFGGASGTAEGVPMTLELVIQDLAKGGSPFTGAAVYVWHCDREGRYSLYSAGATDQNYLRGVQIADSAGRVRFTSIFPACYAGRRPHIHFEVYPDEASIADVANAITTSQVALPEDVCATVYARQDYAASARNISRVSLDGDNVFGDDGGARQLGTVTGDVTNGYTVSLVVGVDAATPAGGRARAGRLPSGPAVLGPAQLDQGPRGGCFTPFEVNVTAGNSERPSFVLQNASTSYCK
ncbi:intradiol ring-cleavage dioxygenase [Protofrankia coriariae]|uniref:intradiol ring-cleavage dioxygenase n=1 Tax=Protofrankia coriariae TaxID=1562887 RepID=UPI000A321BB6|nr:intradiol ring-cleavage dioxygenase [Protofrankia coriariae]